MLQLIAVGAGDPQERQTYLPKAADTFREIWRYLEIISREAGYLIYDPQIDCLIDPSAGFEDSLACYTGAIGQIHKTLPVRGTDRKPWWKFW